MKKCSRHTLMWQNYHKQQKRLRMLRHPIRTINEWADRSFVNGLILICIIASVLMLILPGFFIDGWFPILGRSFVETFFVK